jgi:hypothetical protein
MLMEKSSKAKKKDSNFLGGSVENYHPVKDGNLGISNGYLEAFKPYLLIGFKNIGPLGFDAKVRHP